MTAIKKTDIIEPGTLVTTAQRKNGVVYEVLETRIPITGPVWWLEGRLRHTGTGRSVGWKYLDLFRVVEPADTTGDERK